MLDPKNTWVQNKDEVDNVFWQRRSFMSTPISISLGALPLMACSQDNSRSTINTANSPENDAGITPEDAELRHRFRGIYGGQRRIDGLVEMNNVALHNEAGNYLQAGSFGPRGAGLASLGGKAFIVPKSVRMMWFTEDAQLKFNPFPPPAYEGGTIRADFTVSVASRFPIEVLDEARKKGAGLRLKLRVHPEGVMVGWDIERRPGYEKYTEKEIRERNLHLPPVYSFTGGDFKEARGVYVNAIRSQENGWYIHPKTGQRIETDF